MSVQLSHAIIYATSSFGCKREQVSITVAIRVRHEHMYTKTVWSMYGSVSLYTSVPVSMSRVLAAFSMSPSPTPIFYTSLCPCVDVCLSCRCLSLCISLCLCICLSVSRCVSVSTYLCIFASLYLCITLPHLQRHRIPLCHGPARD